MKVSVEEYVLTWNSQFGFILIDNKTMAGKIVSESEALKLSKKKNVGIVWTLISVWTKYWGLKLMEKLGVTLTLI